MVTALLLGILQGAPGCSCHSRDWITLSPYTASDKPSAFLSAVLHKHLLFQQFSFKYLFEEVS